MSLDDFQWACGVVSSTGTAIALNRFVENPHKVRAGQGHVHGALACFAVDPHRLVAARTLRDETLVPKQLNLRSIPVGDHTFYSVAFASIQVFKVVLHHTFKPR